MNVIRNKDSITITITKSDGYIYNWLSNGDTEEIIKNTYAKLSLYDSFIDNLWELLNMSEKTKGLTELSKNINKETKESFNILAEPKKKEVDLSKLEEKLKNFI